LDAAQTRGKQRLSAFSILNNGAVSEYMQDWNTLTILLLDGG